MLMPMLILILLFCGMNYIAGYTTNTSVKIIVSVKDDILPSRFSYDGKPSPPNDLQNARDEGIQSALVSEVLVHIIITFDSAFRIHFALLI